MRLEFECSICKTKDQTNNKLSTELISLKNQTQELSNNLLLKDNTIKELDLKLENELDVMKEQMREYESRIIKLFEEKKENEYKLKLQEEMLAKVPERVSSDDESDEDDDEEDEESETSTVTYNHKLRSKSDSSSKLNTDSKLNADSKLNTDSRLNTGRLNTGRMLEGSILSQEDEIQSKNTLLQSSLLTDSLDKVVRIYDSVDEDDKTIEEDPVSYYLYLYDTFYFFSHYFIKFQAKVHILKPLVDLEYHCRMKGVPYLPKRRCQVGQCRKLTGFYCTKCTDLGTMTIFCVCVSTETSRCYHHHIHPNDMIYDLGYADVSVSTTKSQKWWSVKIR